MNLTVHAPSATPVADLCDKLSIDAKARADEALDVALVEAARAAAYATDAINAADANYASIVAAFVAARDAYVAASDAMNAVALRFDHADDVRSEHVRVANSFADAGAAYDVALDAIRNDSDEVYDSVTAGEREVAIEKAFRAAKAATDMSCSVPMLAYERRDRALDAVVAPHDVVVVVSE